MTGNRLLRAIAALSIVALLAGCDSGSHPSVRTTHLSFHSSSYADPEKQRQFKEALKQAGVPHEIYVGEDGKEYVQWTDRDSSAVESIKTSLFGEPLPSGRHIHFGSPDHELFKKWLSENGIPFITRQSDGREYVIWEARDYARVRGWKDFPREHYDKIQELSSNPTVERDARKDGAPPSP